MAKKASYNRGRSEPHPQDVEWLKKHLAERKEAMAERRAAQKKAGLATPPLEAKK